MKFKKLDSHHVPNPYSPNVASRGFNAVSNITIFQFVWVGFFLIANPNYTPTVTVFLSLLLTHTHTHRHPPLYLEKS